MNHQKIKITIRRLTLTENESCGTVATASNVRRVRVREASRRRVSHVACRTSHIPYPISHISNLISQIILLFVCAASLYGQTPVLAPIDHNPALRHTLPTMRSKALRTDTIRLPFVDDFSYYTYSLRPDPALWTDSYVYINNSYPIQPRSNGVATFDALDPDGNIYPGTGMTFPADTLTSRPIDLGEDGIRDVYLSFFYQPQGNGDNPEAGDSLIVQFKQTDAQQWQTVWNTAGTAVHPFKQVLIPVESHYLRKGFQFRFVNLVSLDQDKFNPGRKGNADHWHVDYVRLDRNRSATDTAVFDVAVAAPMKTLIRGYQAIPWNQLQFVIASRLEPLIEITYRNNDNVAHLVSRHFEITDVYKNIVYPLTALGDENIEADETMTFMQDISNPFESTTVDSALFELKGYIGTNAYDRRANDTVRFYQFFKNYFARDDGVPETGYGFSGINVAGCAVACRYETFMPDSLQAVRIYFNPTDRNASAGYRFRVAVWRDNNGRPGEQLYLSPDEYTPEKTGQFTQYRLQKAVYAVKAYWVGWVQTTATGFLNVGFDRNYNDRGNLYYNNGSWRQDYNEGTLMIRPVFGKASDFPTSANLPQDAAGTATPLKIYPNPATPAARLTVELPDAPDDVPWLTEIYSATGRLCYRAPYTPTGVDLHAFRPGTYIIRLVNPTTQRACIQKLIITQ